jgi:hypothetical protein
MILTVVSGGQTGVDQAAWRAARRLGIETGGWMPHGFLTEAGCRPEFADDFNARPHGSAKYPPRTVANIEGSDATLIIAPAIDSRGTILAVKTCMDYNRPYRLIVPLAKSLAIREYERPVRVVTTFLRTTEALEGKPFVLNVAGSRESKNPGIGAWAEEYLLEVFQLASIDP